MPITFEECLEAWNRDLYTDILTFVLDDLGIRTLPLNSPERMIVQQSLLEWALSYSHFCKNEVELLVFLKAICVRLLLEDKDKDENAAISSERGKLWNRSISKLSAEHQQLLILTAEQDTLLSEVRAVKSILTQSIYEALFEETLSRLKPFFSAAADALRDTMETELIKGES